MHDPLPELSAHLFRRRLIVTGLALLAIGVVMNSVGHWLSIAWFKHWWQIVPCYLGYVLPLSLLLHGTPTRQALATSTLAFIPLELIGYAIGTSVIADGNVIARAFGAHNFTLVMVLLVAPTPLLGNAIANRVLRLLDGLGAPPSSMP